MKQADLAIIQSDMLTLVASAVNSAHEALTSKFSGVHETNEETDIAFDKSRTVAKLVLAQSLHPIAKMWLDEAKTDVDREVGTDTEPVPGGEMILHEDNVLRFSKRMNKNSTTCSARDLCTELARLGVEKAVVDKAVANAEKVKRGNVYYEVKANEN